MQKPRIQITLFDEYNAAKVTVCYDLDQHDERQQINIMPPDKMFGTFEECVHRIKARNYREVNFSDIGRRLGRLMAERLADLEGWHGEERMEKTNDE